MIWRVFDLPEPKINEKITENNLLLELMSNLWQKYVNFGFRQVFSIEFYDKNQFIIKCSRFSRATP